MKYKKILITGGDKETRAILANTIHDGCLKQGLKATVDFFGEDAISTIIIPSSVSTAIFVACHEGKKFAGIYERLIKGSPDKLSFLHIELK